MQIGIDLGGGSAKIGLIDDSFRIVRRASVPTGYNCDFEETMDRIAGAVKKLPKAEHIGIGAPSSITPKERIVIHANNLGWVKRDVAGALMRRFDVPVQIANDADCAVLAEYICGAARGVDNVLLLTIGTGVGGGIVNQGKLFLGYNGCGFEPGHMIIQENGRLCTCGRRGCMDTCASASSIVRRIREALEGGADSVLRDMIARNGGNTTSKMLFDACAAGDALAQKILEEYLHSLAVGISNLVTLLRPKLILLGGGIGQAGDQLYVPLRKLVRGMTYGVEVMGCPQILPAALGNDAGIIGAAMLYRAGID